MTGPDPEQSAPQQTPREAAPTSEQARTADYLVGKWRPPVETRWKPGQSGNPKGRPRDRPNKKTVVRRVMDRKVKFLDGEAYRQIPLLEANLLTHAAKGAKGDVRSTSLVLKYADKAGLLDDQSDRTAIEDPERYSLQNGAVLVHRNNEPRPSEALFENLDPDLLSRDEMIELSRLAEIIDLGGDITALSTGDFERIKHLVNKGRGKDITPQ